jgi:hypothetical protein
MAAVLAVCVCAVSVCGDSPDEHLKKLTESSEREVLEKAVQALSALTLEHSHVEKLIKAARKDTSDARRLFLWRAIFDAESSAGRTYLQEALTKADDGIVVEFVSRIKWIRVGDLPLLMAVHKAAKSELVRHAINRLRSKPHNLARNRDLPAEMALMVPDLKQARMSANEKNAAAWMKAMTAHEVVFRRIDADGNGVQDFWTADVAGFYAVMDSRGKKIKFIDIMSAKADAAPKKELYAWKPPAKPTPKAGYYFKVMTKDSDGKPYCQDPDKDGKKTSNLSQWAFCAYPANYGKDGVKTFIVNEEGVVYSKDTAGKPVDQWPGEDPTKAKWSVAYE